MSLTEQLIPPGYEPEDWPSKWCTYEEAGGFAARLRSAGSRESRAIAEERGVHWTTVSRAVKWWLISKGEYAPKEWRESERRRRAAARKTFLDWVRGRDKKMKKDAEQINQARDALAEQRRVMELREAREELQVKPGRQHREDEGERLARIRRQNRLRNQTIKRRNGWK